MRKFFMFMIIVILSISTVYPEVSFDKPRIGIVISKASL